MQPVIDLTQGYQPVVVAIDYPEIDKIIVEFRVWYWNGYHIAHERCWYESTGEPADTVVDPLDMAEAAAVAATVIADQIADKILENENYEPLVWN